MKKPIVRVVPQGIFAQIKEVPVIELGEYSFEDLLDDIMSTPEGLRGENGHASQRGRSNNNQKH